MNRREGVEKNYSVREITTEYFRLQMDYVQAEKENDDEQMKLIQRKRNKLLSEIREIDPDFKEESFK